MQRKPMIGVMGPGLAATAWDLENAYALGLLIAQANWGLLTGGRNVGVMAAANRGAKEAGGLTVGVLPNADTRHISEFVDVAICTDLGNGRNNVNVLSSDVVIACGMGLGTASEVALALKNGKSVILLTEMTASHAFFRQLAPHQVFIVYSVQDAIATVHTLLAST
ncbi:MAG: cytochrome [Kamptonema sp. SIO4C4]|nr:cytochrome [Kamptonema sp. SIO4C4]